MGKIVFAGAMSHVLDPEYYDRACGALGRRTVQECMAQIAAMGERFSATNADARVVAASPWTVGIIATGGLSHFPELSLPRVGETDTVFDRKLIHWMETGEHEPLLALSADELHKSGEHEFLNWMVLLGAVTPAR